MSAKYDPILGKLREKDGGDDSSIKEILGSFPAETTDENVAGYLTFIKDKLENGEQGLTAEFVKNGDGVNTYTMITNATINGDNGTIVL